MNLFKTWTIGLGMVLFLAGCVSTDGDAPSGTGELGLAEGALSAEPVGTVDSFFDELAQDVANSPNFDLGNMPGPGAPGGEYCAAMRSCVCGLYAAELGYDMQECLDAVDLLAESDCEDILEIDFPECLPVME